MKVSCDGKRGYSNWLTAARMARRTNDGRGTAVAPYRCHYCSQFHVGTTKPKQPRPQPADSELE